MAAIGATGPIEPEEDGIRRVEQAPVGSPFQMVFDRADIGIALSKPDGVIVLANPAFQEMLGYDVEEMNRRGWIAMTHEDDRASNLAEHRRVVAGATEGYRITKRFLGRGCRIVWTDVTTSAVRSAAGRLLHTITVISDITVRMETEHRLDQFVTALARSEGRFANARQLTKIGSWETDLKAGTTTYSPQMFSIIGADPATFEPGFDQLLERILPEDRDYLVRFRDVVRATPGYHETGYRIGLSDGSVRHIRLLAEAIFEKPGRPVLVRGTLQDVTEQVEGERALRESEARLQAVFDHSPSLIYLKDTESRLILSNKKFQDFYRLDQASDILGTVRLSVPDELADRFERWDRQVVAERRSLRTAFQYRHPDGKTYEMDSIKFPVFGTDGEVLGVGGIVSDVSEMKERERELSSAKRQAELEAARADLAAKEADAANRAKSDFLAAMSHEIRTPMNGVLGMVGVLMQMDLAPELREKIEVIQSSGETLLSLLNDILDHAKIESGRVELEMLDFDPRDLMKGVEALWRSHVEGKGLDFAIDVDPNVASAVNSDPTRIRQILSNLVGNAAKFTETGGIRIGVSQRRLSGAGLELRFEVEDTGIGIAAGASSEIFGKFSQADNSTTRRYGGSGLGLSICKELVGLFDGDIGVESEEGEGSRFWFTVRCTAAEGRLADPPPPPPAPRDAVDAAGERPIRVLVAEDNKVNQMVIRVLLEAAGHRVDVAGDGIAAVDAVRHGSYDIVLMDMRMPRMDGIAATAEIRGLPGELSRIPIIALTANAMKGDRERVLAAGMNDYTTKPIRPQDLAQAIARQLGTAPAGARLGAVQGAVETPEAKRAELAELLGGLEADTADTR